MMSTRNVVLTDRQESLIDALVGSGRYQNASEVMREGLRLIEQREAEDAARLESTESRWSPAAGLPLQRAPRWRLPWEARAVPRSCPKPRE